MIKLWVLFRIIGGIMFISLSFTRIAQAGWKGNFINCFWNVCICLSVNVRKLLHATWWISGKLCIYWICILKQYISCSITMYLILAKNDYTCWYKSYHDIWLMKSMLWKCHVIIYTYILPLKLTSNHSMSACCH